MTNLRFKRIIWKNEGSQRKSHNLHKVLFQTKYTTALKVKQDFSRILSRGKYSQQYKQKIKNMQKEMQILRDF